MPQDLSPETLPPAKVGVTGKANREFAWQIAPSLVISFKYAWSGVVYAFRTQRNFRIHVMVGSLAILLSILLRLPVVEMCIICLTAGAVLTLELMNTAIESVVDLTVKQTYHDLAKIAKDCAAAAVLIASFVSVLIAGFLLVPPLLHVVQPLVFPPHGS